MRFQNMVLVGLVTASMMLASSAHAATATMKKSFKSGTIYATGTGALGGFSTGYNDYAKGSFLGGNKPQITSLAYTWSPYTNGRTSEKVEICYIPWTGGDLVNCVDVSSAQSGSTTAFNNIDFKYGTAFYIRHTLTGGTYPALRPDAGDSISITYNYVP